MDKFYTPLEAVNELKKLGFSYTTHGIRKQEQYGCIPSFKSALGKRRLYDETDLYFIKMTAYMRIAEMPLEKIRTANEFIYKHMYKDREPLDRKSKVANMKKVAKTRTKDWQLFISIMDELYNGMEKMKKQFEDLRERAFDYKMIAVAEE